MKQGVENHFPIPQNNTLMALAIILQPPLPLPRLVGFHPECSLQHWPALAPRYATDYHARTQREHASYVTSEKDRIQVVPAGTVILKKRSTTQDYHRGSLRKGGLPPAIQVQAKTIFPETHSSTSVFAGYLLSVFSVVI